MKKKVKRHIDDLLHYHNRGWYNYLPYKDTYFYINLSMFIDFLKIDIGDLINIISTCMEHTGTTRLCFDYPGEGIPYIEYDKIHKIVDILSKSRNINPRDIIVLSGAVDCVENQNLYLKYIKKYNWPPLTVIFTDYWEVYYSGLMSQLPEIYLKFSSEPRNKTKFFLNFNRCAREHRTAFLALSLLNGWNKKSFISFYHPTLHKEKERYLPNGYDTLFPNTFDEINEILKVNQHVLPMKLNLSKERDNPHDLSEEVEYFNDSYFSVVSETKFFHDIGLSCLDETDATLDCYFFTEKIYKAISARHPFVLLSIPGALEMLRKKGYRTFHPFIDETYDTVTNNEGRLLAIVDECKRLEQFTDSQWIDWQYSVKEIVDHNYNKLINVCYRG